MALFTVDEARVFDKGQLSDGDKFSDDAITDEAARIKELFERVCGIAFEPTTETNELHDGDGGVSILLDHRPVISIASADTRIGTIWTALTSDELADLLPYPSGKLVRESLGTWPAGLRNVRVTYSHGLATVPAEIKKAALIVAVTANIGLIKSNIARTAMSMSDEFGTTRYLTPGIGNSITGIGEVDVLLNDYRDRYYVPAVD